MALTTSFQSVVNVSYSKAASPFGDTPIDTLAKTYALSLATGTGANNADILFRDQRTLTASSSENLDLNGGNVDAFGTALAMLKMKVMIFFAAVANVNTVVVSRPAANGVPWTAASATVTLNPGGFFAFFDPLGVAVTAGTGDLVTVTNGAAGTSVLYDVVIIGASA